MQVKYKPLCYLPEKQTSICRIIFQRHYKYLLCSLTVIAGFILYLAGVITLLCEIDFTEYTYPLEIDNINILIDQIEFERTHNNHNHNNPNSFNYGIFRNSIVNYSTIEKAITEYTDVKPIKQFENIDILLDVKSSCSKSWYPVQQQALLLSMSQKKLRVKGRVPTKDEFQFTSDSQAEVSTTNLNLLNSSTNSRRQSSPSSVSFPSCNNNLKELNFLEPIRILIIIKSAVNNYHRRQAIRDSWYVNGKQQGDEFTLKTVFIVGACDEKNFVPQELGKSWSIKDCRHHIKMESNHSGDLIQGSFVDMYYNNTLKTFTAMRWINDNCQEADFILALDDDYFLELNNLLNYIKTITATTDSLLFDPPGLTSSLAKAVPSPKRTLKDGHIAKTIHRAHQNEVLDMIGCQIHNDTRLDNIRLMRIASYRNFWAGFVRFYVEPLRHLTSKWYLSYKQYPYNLFPPFVSGGATLMSRRTITDFYYASYFTKSFIFDDVYIGLIAYKLNIDATHNENFMSPLEELIKNPYNLENSTRIAVHDIDPDVLVNLWNNRKEVNRK